MIRLQLISKAIKSEQQFLYSVPIGEKKKGQSRIYRHPDAVHGLLDVPKGIKNFGDFWERALKKRPNHKIIENLTYSQVNELTKKIGSWLVNQNHSKIFLYCKNSPEWTLTDIAASNYGVITIPLYDTLGQQAFDHILNLTEGTLLITTSSMFESLLKNLKRNKGKVNQIVFFDSITNEMKKKIQDQNMKVIQFQQICKNNKVIERPNNICLDDGLTYAFTSGTTGLPKGAIQTHRNAISQSQAMKGYYQKTQSDVHMSYLPIAHTFERFIIWTCLNQGANIQYSKFPPTQIMKDLATIRPTTIPIVPRLLNKLYPVMKQIYQKQKSNQTIKKLFGGRLRMMVTGSAPVSPQILKFFYETLQLDLRQGYGQTQTTAASFVTKAGDTNYGHVGGPNMSLQLKLVDVPQMNYTSDSNPPKGQVCMRGNSIFIGYYQDPQNTKEALDSQGWNHSGDIGVILPNGSLKIIDRKKNIYKLSQGQYIAPEKIQNVYVRCKYIAECFLYGDSLRDYNVAVAHPNLDTLPAIAKSLNIQQTDPAKLCENKQITNFILTQMNKQAGQDGLFGFQVAKRLRLWPQSFGTYGIFTSTMKLQRFVAKKTFIEEINKLYAS